VSIPARKGFTLIEVMVSITICLVLCGLATSIFFQVRAIMRRTQARLELHNHARFLFEAMRRDLMALEQEGACYIESTADAHPELPPGDNRHTGEVRLTFLRGRVDNQDYNPDDDGGSAPRSDLVWTQWKFDQRNAAVCAGSNGRARYWRNWTHWADGAGHDFGQVNQWRAGHLYMAMPQPRRAAGSDAATTLDDNRFDKAYDGEVGDYKDLTGNLTPATRGVTAFELEAVLADGKVVHADVRATKNTALDGEFVDGHVPAGPASIQPHRHRPRLFRVRFDLTDAESRLTQSFSFSFQPSTALPPL
jgi:prepilin-type N-terminal cleavage/methylation domain-containing protein